MPKMFRTIIMWDGYVVAESSAEARETMKRWISEGAKPSEEVATEARDISNVRESWRDQTPLVGDSVSDKDFERVKGKTTPEAWKTLYTKTA